METDPVQGDTPQEASPSRRDRARTGARAGHRHPDSDTTPARGPNGVAAPLRSSAGAATATGEGRRATTSASAGGLTSTRTRARTRMTAAAAALSSDGRTGRQYPIGPTHRASRQQPTMARLASLATRLQPVSSLPEQSPDTLGSSQSATMGPGSSLTTPLPLGESRTPDIECSPLPGEARHQTPGFAPLTSPARTRNWIGAFPSSGQSSIAIAGLEPPGIKPRNGCHRPRRSQSGS